MRIATLLLLDLGVFFSLSTYACSFLRITALVELRLDLVERRRRDVARILELDDVPAELGLHGLLGDLAFLQALDRIARTA